MNYQEMTDLARSGEKTPFTFLRQKETWHELTPEQLTEASHLARLRGAGTWTLKQIYGEEWALMRRIRRYGVLFKRAVRDGAVVGVRWIGTSSSKSALYEVTA